MRWPAKNEAGYQTSSASFDETVPETIKVITHSMGAAYRKGYVKKLKQLLNENGYGKSVLISLVADFDPYQANHLAPVKDVFTMQFTHDGFLADYRQWRLDDASSLCAMLSSVRSQ